MSFLNGISRHAPGSDVWSIGDARSSVQDWYRLRHVALDPLPPPIVHWRVRPARLRRSLQDALLRWTEPRRSARASTLLSGSRVLVMPGTGLIDDFGQRSVDMPTHLDRWTSAAERAGIPVVFLSVGVSRISQAASRRLFRRSLDRAQYCSFRDAASLQNAEAIGFRRAASVSPDLAFALPTVGTRTPNVRGSIQHVGVGVMGYYGWNLSGSAALDTYARYLGRLVVLVDALLGFGLVVSIFPGDLRADAQTLDDLRRNPQIGQRGRLRFPVCTTFHDIRREIAETDAFVGSRFHNLVFALMAGVPAYSIGYSDKNDAVMAAFGRQEYCHFIDSFDPISVASQIIDSVASGESAALACSARARSLHEHASAELERFACQFLRKTR